MHRMYRILELRSISAIDKHNWATNKTECRRSTDKYVQVRASTTVTAQKQIKSKQTHLFVCPS
jgi:hypothetical protein